MSESATPPVEKSRPWVRWVVDYGPLLVWGAAYLTYRARNPDTALENATWWLVGGAIVCLTIGWLAERRVAVLPLLAGLAAVVFGSLTLVFHDTMFVKIKPTVINGFFAIALLGGLAFRRLFLKDLIGEQLHMADAAWRQLTLRYGVFFIFQAVLNEIVWRTQPEERWVLFRFPGLMLLTLIFTVAMVPFMMKHGRFGAQEPHTPDLPPS